ncbi:MAG: 30S ribosomal protein S6 [Candidatus Eisenbacteria bacterium]|uniref:Small ribosomal subunit protein bS6 n=1 Tax=Eiseniibacteriota bacterium TaxID=2212470 RepID=A0A538TM30_UNCEI|nr:MAG: 30S ribosomal protein S6 [Candidatus Eisenbacteria bacterium]
MKLYETTVVFDPGLEEARVNEEVERITQPIAQAGGEVIEVQRWGKRKLAYMIRKRRDGTYVHVKHKSPPELIAEMDRRFRLNESVLRHLTVLAVKESRKTLAAAAEAAAKAAEAASASPVAAAPAAE